MKKECILINKEYQGNCAFTGRPTETFHELVYGRGRRNLSIEDGLTIPVADVNDKNSPHWDMHHHETSMALSKMLGQMAYEMDYYRKIAMNLDESVETSDARESFRRRYGESYL